MKLGEVCQLKRGVRIPAHLRDPSLRSRLWMIFAHHLLPLVIEASRCENIFGGARDHAMPTTFVADESWNRSIRDERTLIAKVVAEQKISLNVGKDRLPGRNLAEERHGRVHVRGALSIGRNIRQFFRRR